MVELNERPRRPTWAGGGSSAPGGAGFRPAMTLIEVLIVVVILSILAVVVAPRYLDASDQAKEAAAAQIVSTARTQIQVYFLRNGEFPVTIDPKWFHDCELANPYWPDHPKPYCVDTDAEKLHPTTKHLEPTSSSTFWYNKANGRFAARVEKQPTAAQTIALYNRVNNANIKSLDQTNIKSIDQTNITSLDQPE